MTNAAIKQIDQRIDEVRAELLSRETVDQLDAESWQAAWDRHPELRAQETELFRQRGFAQQEQAEADERAARKRYGRVSPTTNAPLHPVRKACIEAAVKLVALQFKPIVGEPDMSDAKALQQDLDAIASIVDPIILAVGHYAKSNFGRIDLDLFTDQLRRALDGEATYEIEQAAARYREDFAA